MSVFRVIPCGGEKHINKIPPQSRDNPVKHLFMCYFLQNASQTVFPTREGSFSSFKITLAVRVIARQLRDKNCLEAILPRDIKMSLLAHWEGMFEFRDGETKIKIKFVFF